LLGLSSTLMAQRKVTSGYLAMIFTWEIPRGMFVYWEIAQTNMQPGLTSEIGSFRREAQ
jgi:hypothetical protein